MRGLFSGVPPDIAISNIQHSSQKFRDWIDGTWFFLWMWNVHFLIPWSNLVYMMCYFQPYKMVSCRLIHKVGFNLFSGGIFVPLKNLSSFSHKLAESEKRQKREMQIERYQRFIKSKAELAGSIKFTGKGGEMFDFLHDLLSLSRWVTWKYRCRYVHMR